MILCKEMRFQLQILQEEFGEKPKEVHLCPKTHEIQQPSDKTSQIDRFPIKVYTLMQTLQNRAT